MLRPQVSSMRQSKDVRLFISFLVVFRLIPEGRPNLSPMRQESATAYIAKLEAENAKLKRELDAAVKHHAHYTSSIDRALGQPRLGGDLLTNHLKKIALLT